MKKGLLISYLITVFAVVGFSQKNAEKPDFSGKWISDDASFYSSIVITHPGAPKVKCKLDVVIEHHDPELKITRTSVCEDNKGVKTTHESNLTYFTDGRGEVNRWWDNSSEISTTAWDGSRIAITTYEMGAKGEKSPDMTKKLSISKDRDKLTERTSKAIPFAWETLGGRQSYTERVFRILK